MATQPIINMPSPIISEAAPLPKENASSRSSTQQNKNASQPCEQRNTAVAEQQAQPPPFVRFAISEIVVNRLAKVGAACFGQLIGWQMDYETQRTLPRNLFRRADDVLLSVVVEITLVKGRGIERVNN